jgi:hypothetical protein
MALADKKNLDLRNNSWQADLCKFTHGLGLYIRILP